MATIQRPETQEDMLYQLWFAVIGSNGDGIASRVRDLDDRVGRMEATMPLLWTREDHECAEREYAARDKAKDDARREHIERRKLSRRDWIVISISAIGVIIAGFALIGGPV